MDARRSPDATVPEIAAAIAAPARTRMLYSLMDGRPRTSTELALLADVTPSTASIHLQHLRSQRLVSVVSEGKHRCYSLASADVAAALEALSALAGSSPGTSTPQTTSDLRVARSCYDHMAGCLGVALYERLVALGWLSIGATSRHRDRDLTTKGASAIAALGIDVEATRARHRRFAYACLDWSEQRPHLGGALGAALLESALKKKWVVRERGSRVLSVTGHGRREIFARFGARV
ncbi:MAG TPA: winged helix-turn-helix domain-containing protein [Gemmatimonadaceae bacterium]